MTALRKILLAEEPVVATAAARTPDAKLYLVTDNAPAEVRAPATVGGALKNVLLFFAAPFIGLVYIVALPIVGFGALAVVAARAAAKFKAVKLAGVVLKNVGMVVAAPVIGLAFFVLFPLVGLAGLAWIGGRAMVGAGAR